MLINRLQDFMAKKPEAPKPNAPKQEVKQIPNSSRTAIALTQQAHANAMEMLAQQILADMGLKMSDGWRVYPNEGVIMRQVAGPTG